MRKRRERILNLEDDTNKSNRQRQEIIKFEAREREREIVV